MRFTFQTLVFRLLKFLLCCAVENFIWGIVSAGVSQNLIRLIISQLNILLHCDFVRFNFLYSAVQTFHFRGSYSRRTLKFS